MKSFCPHCGTLTNYAGVKPKFCPSCGEALDSFSVKKKTEPAAEIEAEIEDVEEDSVPNISELEVEIERYEIPKQTLGQVMENNKDVTPANKSNIKMPESPKISQDDFLESFKKEAGTLRRK